MADAQWSVHSGQECQGEGGGLGVLRRTALVVGEEPLEHVGSGAEQIVVEPEALCLGDAPGVDVLASYPVFVFERSLQNQHGLPGTCEHGGHSTTSDACSDHHHIG